MKNLNSLNMESKNALIKYYSIFYFEKYNHYYNFLFLPNNLIYKKH